MSLEEDAQKNREDLAGGCDSRQDERVEVGYRVEDKGLSNS